MPIVIEIDSFKRLILTTMYGTVTDADLVSHVTQVRRGSEHAGFDELLQSRGELTLKVSEAGLRRVAEIIEANGADGRTHRLAIVVKTSAGAALAKSYRALVSSTGTIVQTFDSHVAAIEWLRPKPKPGSNPA
jgi:hypothetical protein